MRRALEGAYGAYFVTFFWAHFSPDKEMAEARSMANAAKAAGVRHVIWSSLEDVRKFVPLSDPRMPTLQGKYKVPHFDAKGEADHFFTDAGLRTTFLYASFYWENLIYFGAGPKKGPDGSLYLTCRIGDAKMAGIASEDIGRVAYGIFKAGDTYVGQIVGVAGEHLTGAEMAAKLSRALGREIRFNAPSPDEYRALWLSGRGRARQHVPVLRRLRGAGERGARRRALAQARPRAAVVRPVAAAQRGEDPARVTAAARSC